MGNHSATILLKATLSNDRLTYLNLNKNELTDVIAPCLKEVITQNHILIALFIGWNKFTSRGAIELAEGLTQNKTL
jgi:hypothetical protein